MSTSPRPGTPSAPGTPAEITKRRFSEERRRQLAAEGKALPSGAYPIEDESDLRSAAILARSGHGEVRAARKLVARRARELGVPNPLAKPGKGDGGTAEKADLGPRPDAGRTLTEDHARPSPGNPGRPAQEYPPSRWHSPLLDGLRDHSARQAIAQGHPVTSPRVPGADQIIRAAVDYQPARVLEPAAVATLALSPGDHGYNPMNTGAHGEPVTVRVEFRDMAGAASAFPADVRATPHGAAGIPHRQPEHVARTAFDHPPFVTPHRPAGFSGPPPGMGGPLARGDLQRPGPGPSARPAGWEYSTPAPGERR